MFRNAKSRRLFLRKVAVSLCSLPVQSFAQITQVPVRVVTSRLTFLENTKRNLVLVGYSGVMNRELDQFVLTVTHTMSHITCRWMARR